MSQSAGGACSNLNEFVNQYQYVGVSTETEHLPEKISIDAGAVINIGLNGDSMAQILYSGFGRIAVRGYAVWDNLKWTPWMILATTTPPQVYDLPLADGWIGTIRYSKTQDGMVTLFVAVSKETATGVGTFSVGQLPAGYYPRYEVSCAAVNVASGAVAPTASRLIVEVSGNLVIQQPDATAIGFSASITFAS